MKRGAKASCDSLNCVATHREAVECEDTLGRTASANRINLATGVDRLECEICGRSDNERKVRKIHGMWLCSKHITQLYRNGSFLENTIYQPNDIVICEDHAEIVLRDKHSDEVGRAIIDTDDVDRCREYKWHLRKAHGRTNYVIASLPGNKKIHLHRFILNYDGELDVDHINRNGLDNRKSNLRIVTHQTNTTNQQGVGVVQVPSGRYQARVCRNYKTIYLGTFDTYDEALCARERFIQSE